MLYFIRSIGVVALHLLTASSTFAEGAGSEWDTLIREAGSLYEKGQYDRAVVAARKTLEVAEKNAGPDHPHVAESLENMAALYRATHREKEAEKLEAHAAKIRAIKR